MEINTLYHYTKLSTSLEYILQSMRLLLNPISKTNDPRENKPFAFMTLVDEFDYTRDSKKLYQRYSDELRRNCKVICFSTDFEYKKHLIKGYNLSRMWAQYGDNHKGICLGIDKETFRKENGKFIDDGFFKPVTYFGVNRGFYPTIDERQAKNYTRKQILAETINLHSDYLFFSKLIDWESEHEFRLVHFSNTSKIQYCAIQKSLKAIYLGVDFNMAYLPSIRSFSNGVDLFKLDFHHDQLKPKKIPIE